MALEIFTSPLSRLGKYLATIHLDFREYNMLIIIEHTVCPGINFTGK